VAAAARARIFISYSRREAGLVDTLSEMLGADGFEPLVDRKDIAPGEPWQERIGALIAGCDAAIVVISRSWIDSAICRWELAEIERMAKRLVPVAATRGLESELPASVSRLNLIFADEPARLEPALVQIAAAISADLAWVREHTRIGEAAARWQAGGRKSASLHRGSELEAGERWAAARPQDAPEITQEQRTFLAASRKAATRRLQGYLGAALAVAFLAGGLAVYAEGQRRLAVEKRAEAEANLRGATEAIGIVLFETVERLRGEAGLSTALQRRLIEATQPGINRLLASQPDNAALQRLQATTLAFQSDTMRQQGAHALALQRLDEAVPLFERLAEPAQASTEQLKDLAITLGKRALARLATGNEAGGLADATRAASISREILVRSPQDPNSVFNLAAALRQLAQARSRAHPEEDVSSLIAEVLALVKPFTERPGAPYQAAINVSEALYLRSGLEMARKDWPKARATLEEAYRFVSAQVSANRSATWPVDSAVLLFMRMSDVELAEGRSDPARSLLFRAMQEINQVIDRDRNNATFISRLIAIADRLTGERFALPTEETRRIARNVVTRMEPFAAQGRLGTSDVATFERYRALAAQ
jgi:tetratricopeptide (TPR) repeat protein